VYVAATTKPRSGRYIVAGLTISYERAFPFDDRRTVAGRRPKDNDDRTPTPRLGFGEMEKSFSRTRIIVPSRFYTRDWYGPQIAGIEINGGTLLTAIKHAQRYRTVIAWAGRRIILHETRAERGTYALLFAH